MNESEFFSLENDRRAVVFMSDGVWHVDLFENDMFVELKTLRGKSVHYAEDLAENWVNCWGAFSK